MNDERRPKAAPEVAAFDSTTRYVCIPVQVRRAHRDWSNAERSAWFELMLAAYEHRGYFESMELIRALLSDASAVDALIQRGELQEVSGGWTMPVYWQLYDSTGKLLIGRTERKSLEERLSDAEVKIARGERLTDAEYQARHRAREAGEVIPFGQPRSLTSATDNDIQISDKELDDDDTRDVRPDVSLTSDSSLFEVHRELVGYPPTPDQQRTLVNYRDKLARGNSSLLLEVMRQLPNPKAHGWLQMVGDELKRRAAA